jgi:archaemetzincin
MLAVTMADLYPKESWNFVFGEATYKERVGVFSLARNDPAFWEAAAAAIVDEAPAMIADVRTLLLRRACTTLAHETGHMFGISHCRYYQCLMGGSNGMEESDRAPASLCPVCLHKLYLAHPFAPRERQSALVKFYQMSELANDQRHAQSLLDQATAPGP